jgi:high-affinity nickel-transport protein
VLGLLGDQLALTGPFWEAIGRLNDNFSAFGFAVIAIFVLCWAVSAAIFRWKRYDTLGTGLSR